MKLTAADRCDRCGAQALMVTEHGGLWLRWCVHHAREHGAKLVGCLVIADERPKEANRA